MTSPDTLGEVAFTAEDALAVARHLQEFPSVILVGGQSLNFWAEQFRDNVPELNELAPFESGDVDFLGSIPDAQACAKRLGGTIAYPSPDQINTPEVGVVHCVINDKRLKIDFLAYLAGLNSSDVRKSAIPSEIDGVVLRVMHPLNVMESRLANIYQLRRRDHLALRQMLVSVHVVAEYIRRAAQAASREALSMIESVFELARSPNGVKVWHDFQIDLFFAIRAFEGLPQAFAEIRLPQMEEFLRERRKRYSITQENIIKRKAKSHP